MSLTRVLPNTVTTADYQLDPAPGNEWVELVKPAAELARQIADTDFVPKEMRNKPAAITACILYGAEIGIGPMQSLAKVDIINGRPAPRAELGRALALGAGHEIWVDESTNTRVKVSGRRRGSEKVQSTTWSMDDVRKAGISSAMYTKYPRQMLLARASAELVRMMCPDVLGGVTVFAEEAADIIDPITDNKPAPASSSEPAKATTTRKRPPPQPALAPETLAPLPTPVDDELPPLPDEETAPTTDGPTAAQLKKMMAGFNELGLVDRDDRLAFTIAAIGRTITSSRNLTIPEAATVIDTQERIISGDAEYIINPDLTITINPIDPELPLD